MTPLAVTITLTCAAVLFAVYLIVTHPAYPECYCTGDTLYYVSYEHNKCESCQYKLVCLESDWGTFK